MTTVINLFGGPCSGKSTTAAGLFYEMKIRGMSVELVREYVKNWAYSQRQVEEHSGIYLLGKQSAYESLLYGKVDWIVTDSPILLAGVYPMMNCGISYVSDAAIKFLNHAAELGVRHENIFLNRTGPYDPVGRWQTEEQANGVDSFIKEYLLSNRFSYHEIRPRPGQDNNRAKITDTLSYLGIT